MLVPGRADTIGDKAWSPATPPPELGPAPEPEPEPDTRSWLAKAWEKWDGELSIGLNGTEGNSDVVRLRSGGRLTRKWTRDRVSLRADYRFARDNAGESENRLDSNFRHDRDAGKDGHFGYFTELDIDTDSNLDFDVRARLNTGPTLWWIRNNTTQVRTSAGLAVTREFGAPGAEYIPEFTASLSASHDLTKRIKLTSSVRYDPEAEDLARYRLRSRGAVEFLIDPELRVSLRLEVENRFDSQPASATTQRNDLDYAARLVWRF